MDAAFRLRPRSCRSLPELLGPCASTGAPPLFSHLLSPPASLPGIRRRFSRIDESSRRLSPSPSLLPCRWGSPTSSTSPATRYYSRPIARFENQKASKFVRCFRFLQVLVAAAIAGTIGQLSKPLTSAISGKDIDLRAAVRSGGMPSTHSAAVTAAATLLGLERGFSDSVFGMSVVFAALVMYDAQGVRREVGIHAKILNKIQDDYQNKRPRSSSSMNCKENSPVVSISDKEDSYLFQSPAITSTEVKISDCTKVDNTKEPIHMEQHSHSELNESVGHTEIQVIVGAVLGLVVGLATELAL
ncbi:uncharacterized protein LOC141822345 isoform X1 [Curcuma longa]|uniref:uncharacterized protein LOC141822345 isoform X1 n=1 Tax=Curcuma longa TaxID=136217 RepID=UPI003D9E471B